MLPHFASCRAQFAADLSGTLERCAESSAWGGSIPWRTANFDMKRGAPQARSHARNSYIRPRVYKATCRRAAD
jgi:hypothetical protein